MKKEFYLYRDTFLSGWGKAPRGSYIISEKPVKRSDFKFLGSGFFEEMRFGTGKGRDFELWIGNQAPVGMPKVRYKLKFVGRGKPLKIKKVKRR